MEANDFVARMKAMSGAYKAILEQEYQSIKEDEMTAADRCYMAQFRSEPFRAELIDEDEREYVEQDVGVPYDPELLLCYLCNYKGEGEGIALYEDVEDLPVFKSKLDSFNRFGC